MNRGCPILTAIVGVALAACGGSTPSRSPSPDEVRHTVVRWTECNDCMGGELDSVVALGELAVPVLARFLREGPPPDQRTAFEVRLDSTYNRRAERAAAPAITRDQFKAAYLHGFVVGYQQRAARALGRMDGSAALDSLRAAPIDSVPAAVRAAIRCALDSLCRR